MMQNIIDLTEQAPFLRSKSNKAQGSNATIDTMTTLSSSSLSSDTHDEFLTLLEDGRQLDNIAAESSLTAASAKTRSFWDFLLEPRISQGSLSLPQQAESRPFLKYLIWIPLSSLVSTAFVSYYWLPILSRQGMFTFLETLFWDAISPNRLAMLLMIVLPLCMGLISDLASDIWTFGMLIRGKRRRHLPEHIPRLVHAVIVCNYKEPLEVLRATVASLADNTLSSSTIVVLACEARDEKAESVFQTLSTEFHSSFRNFIKTSHTLAQGEIAGKSSNENYACRELYKMVVEQEGLDPFQVMVTTCDADSLFDTVFLEQVEAEYCRMPNGSRFLYNSPINTYRNLPDCHWLVKSFEIRRCQYDLFSGLSFRPTQSNYSLTLGFAHELNFWDPTNTSEDFHTTLKAMATTGKGSDVVVRVWSLILNDSVTGLYDRWVQAKRHMWGIEEVTFTVSLFPVIRITTWLAMFGRVASQMFGVCIPGMVCLFFFPVRQVLVSLRPETQVLLAACWCCSVVYDWIKALLREFLLYHLVLGNRHLMMKRTVGEWLQLFTIWPLLAEASCIVFATMATWRMLVHAIRHDTLAYVTAPKALNVTNSNTTSSQLSCLMTMTNGAISGKPKKSI